ncbi:hypothetical protein OSB04_019102 [Centaurea solstitialis]|uniref:Myb/SANT-like domain-containing protein n=1 Tax=Centaurea solstitialis TaxID=347529 RepID=A0AA38WDX0_9ASTR|nr:hypothetical protein OSB04_019102 [Centaurea solstitialis]
MDENTRIRWTNEMIKCFLETCIDEVNKVGRNGASLTKDTWTKLATKLEEVCHVKPTQKQLKNQYDYLKGKYSGWVYLRNKTGNIYDPIMNTFTLSNQEWEEFFKGHPKAKTLKTSPLVFPDLCKDLFEGTSATGSRVYAPSSTCERTVVSSSFPPHFHSTQNLEEEDEDDEAPNADIPNVDPSIVSPSPHSSKPNKKRAKVDMDELAWDMKDALQTLVTRQIPPVVPPVVPSVVPPVAPPFAAPSVAPPVVPPPTTTIDACVERLNTLGLDPSDPLYQAAIDIFGHTTLLREAWVIMDNDQEAILLITMFLYVYYMKRMRLKRKRDNTSALTGRQFTDELLQGNDRQCLDLLRMSRAAFIQLCDHFKAKGWLTDSRHISVEEKMAIFLMIIGHNQRYRVLKNRFQHSTQTIHKIFHEVLDKMIIFAKEIIVPTSFNPNPNIPGNNRRLRRVFKGAIGALDGTLIHAIVPIQEQHLYRGRGKGECYQNVLAICDFNMVFTFVVAGWEGVAHDSRVLSEALTDSTIGFPFPPPDKYYLCDAAYTNTRGFMAPYRNVRYWLGDFRRRRATNKYEKFNHSHAKLRNVIERSYGVLKARFPILKRMAPFALEVQRDVVIACFAVHNFIRKGGLSDELFSEYDQNTEQGDNGEDTAEEVQSHGNTADQTYMATLREGIATQLMQNGE